MKRINEQVPPGELPPAQLIRDPQTPIDKIVANWIRWLPASIAFFGLAFVTWTIAMIVQVGRYHDALTEMDQRVKKLERELKDNTEQRWGEYYHRQCVGECGNQVRDEARAECKGLEK